MKCLVATIFFALVLATTGLIASAQESSKVPSPIMVNANGEELHALDIRNLKDRSTSVFFDAQSSMAPLGEILGWRLYIVDMENTSILFSSDGKGPPPTTIPWTGRGDTGEFVRDRQKLSAKLSFTTNEGTIQSEALDFEVVERSALLNRLDIGLHFRPRAGFGWAQLNFSNPEGWVADKAVTLSPTVTTDLSFHLNRSHYWGFVLKSGALIQDIISDLGDFSRVEANHYSLNNFHYHYAVINSALGRSLDVFVGMEALRFLGRAISSEVREGDEYVATEKYSMQIQGLGLSLQLRWFFVPTSSLDLAVFYTPGLGAGQSNFWGASGGSGFGLTNNIDLRLQASYQSGYQAVLPGESMQVNVLALDFFLEMVL